MPLILRDIVNGMPPKLALDLAVENIKAAYERHQNYEARDMEMRNSKRD